jgi:hypothetical protein
MRQDRYIRSPKSSQAIIRRPRRRIIRSIAAVLMWENSGSRWGLASGSERTLDALGSNWGNAAGAVCGLKISSFRLFPPIPGYSQMRCSVSQYIGVMDTPTDNGLNLVLDEFAYVDVVGLTDGDERGVDLWVQLRPNILAIQGHGLSETAGVKKNALGHLRGLFGTRFAMKPVERQCGVSGGGFGTALSDISHPGRRHPNLCRYLGLCHTRFLQVLNALCP